MPPKRVGMNVGHVAEWTANRLADAMKECSTWTGLDTSEIDADGTPLAFPAQTTLFTGQGGKHPSGSYKVEFEGGGTVSIAGDASASNLASGATFNVATPSNSGLGVTFNSPGGSNLRIWKPGRHADGASRIWMPEYVEKLSPVAKVIRFMDAMGTNDSIMEAWDDRARMEYAYWNSAKAVTGGTGKGLPLQAMLALCAQCDSIPWFCFGDDVEDDFVTQFATQLKSLWDRAVIVEYGNEGWNSTFSAFTKWKDYGAGLSLGATDQQNRHRWQKLRSIQIYDLMAAVYGSVASRIKLVISGQHASSAPMTEAMNYLSSQNAKVAACAISVYWGRTICNPAAAPAGNPSGRKPTTLDHIFTDFELERAVRLPLLDASIALHNSFGKETWAYEGGQSLVCQGAWLSDTTLEALCNSAKRDARMEAEYDWWMDTISTRVHTFVHYNDAYTSDAAGADSGRWGAWEYLDQPDSEARAYASLKRAAVPVVVQPIGGTVIAHGGRVGALRGRMP